MAGHSEHTPDYHFFAAAALEQIMRQGWLRSKIYDERAGAISEARNWLRDPKKRVVRIGRHPHHPANRRRIPPTIRPNARISPGATCVSGSFRRPATPSAGRNVRCANPPCCSSRPPFIPAATSTATTCMWSCSTAAVPS
ncbi:MAG: hypothetical protein WDN06_17260 [Asticcacaulis sp.]